MICIEKNPTIHDKSTSLDPRTSFELVKFSSSILSIL